MDKKYWMQTMTEESALHKERKKLRMETIHYQNRNKQESCV